MDAELLSRRAKVPVRITSVRAYWEGCLPPECASLQTNTLLRALRTLLRTHLRRMRSILVSIIASLTCFSLLDIVPQLPKSSAILPYLCSSRSASDKRAHDGGHRLSDSRSIV